MAEYIHSHPEHQMQPPRVWRTHYEDECKEKNKAYSFSALKQYPTLVKISSKGRNNLYGSAKLPSDAVNSGASVKVSDNRQKAVAAVKIRQKEATYKSEQTTVGKQLNIRLTPESALERIEQIMQQASVEINGIIGQLKSMNTGSKKTKP